MPDKWAQAAADFKKGGGGTDSTAASAAGTGGEDWKIWNATGDAPAAAPSLMQRAEAAGKGLLQGAGDVLTGAGKGVGSDVTGLLLEGVRPFISPEQYQLRREKVQSLLAPENTAQTVGKAGEQAAEFLAPGLGEEHALSLLPKVAEDAPLAMRLLRPAARVGYQAATTGLVNKAQGGGFGAGAGMGLLGGVGSEAMRAAAPALAESALGTRLLERGGGRTRGAIGKAALEETTGLTPAAVKQSAGEKIGSLYKERQGVLKAASEPWELAPGATMLPPNASLAGPRGAMDTAMRRAGPLSEGGMSAPSLFDEMGGMRGSLFKEGGTGAEIPKTVTPEYLGRLQQGFSREHLNWNPLRLPSPEANAAGKRAYGLMTEELERTAPESVGLNRRIANLIPVEEGAGRRALAMPLGQRVMGRIGARTGALTLGGGVGYERGGLPGAVMGAGVGAVAPELIWSPTTQMAGARLLYRAAPKYLPAAVGMGLGQFDRPQ